MIFCKHNYKIYNILYGDPINWFDGKRFWYRCIKCSKIIKLRNIKKESYWKNNIFNVDYNIWNW